MIVLLQTSYQLDISSKETTNLLILIFAYCTINSRFLFPIIIFQIVDYKAAYLVFFRLVDQVVVRFFKLQIIITDKMYCSASRLISSINLVGMTIHLE